MKVITSLILLVAVFQGAHLQETLPECSNPIPPECADVSVCEASSCPRYNDIKCCVELVEGECTAQFYRLPQMAVVTDKCFRGIESCSTKECPERRTCVEEVIECPESNPDCGITRVRATCVLNEEPRFPSSCDDIVCAEGTSCVVSETRRGTEAECKEIVPESCDDVVCDEGMECVEQNRPRCVPVRPDKRPSDCSELECPEDLVCMLLDNDRGAKCGKPPPPTSCDELKCALGLTCEKIGNTDRVRCVPAAPPTAPPRPQTEPGFTGEVPTRGPPPLLVRIARQCDQISCEDGYECRLIIDREINGNRRPVATCVPAECPLRRRARAPLRCEEVTCERDEMCVLCGEGEETRARCMPRNPRDEEEERPNRGNGNRRPPRSCEELACGPAESEKCQEFKVEVGRQQRAFCIPNDAPKSCEEAECEKDNMTCIELTNEEVTVAHCVRGRTRPPRPEGTRAPPTRPSRPEGTGSRPTRPSRPEGTGSPPTRPSRPGSRPTRPPRPEGTGSRPTRPSRPEGTGSRPTRPPRPEGTGSPPTRPSRPEGTGSPPTRPSRPEGTGSRPTRPSRPRPEGTRSRPTRPPRPEGTRAPPTRPDPAESCEELDCGRGFECLHVRRGGRGRAMCTRMRRNEVCRAVNDLQPEIGGGNRERRSPSRSRGKDGSGDDIVVSDFTKSKTRTETETKSDDKGESGSGLEGSKSDDREMGSGESRDRTTDKSKSDSSNYEDSSSYEDSSKYGSGREDKSGTKGEEELDENGKPKNNEAEDVELDENGNPKDVEQEVDANGKPKGHTDTVNNDVEVDENDKPKKPESPTDAVNDEVELDDPKKPEVNVQDDKKTDDLPLLRSVRQSGRDGRPTDGDRGRPPRVNTPDLCMERRCCEGESCFVRAVADGRRLLAFCAADDFDGDRPPMPHPRSCEELLCEEGFRCVERRDEEDMSGDMESSGSGEENRRSRNRERSRRGAMCVRVRPDRPTRPERPTGETDRPRPTSSPPNRPRPSRRSIAYGHPRL